VADAGAETELGELVRWMSSDFEKAIALWVDHVRDSALPLFFGERAAAGLRLELDALRLCAGQGISLF